ncbi:hypothetical protein [Enterovirga sp.]|jgi:hypothetical protein|uniref:hypothetical protein n=1 Tax=Enterovirga sp. TaxID=2026350 RepID=UPI0026224155|nr:hypothetical protein [Enterovirga sp.]MDB5589891.1 hypothetical protein [Enterovirga sp.]
MGDLGSYIWFIGLAGGLAVLAIGYIVAESRKRKAGTVAHPNNAWEQAAAESGHPEVARPKATGGDALR